MLDKEIVPDPGLFAHADTKPDVKVFSTRAEACAAVRDKKYFKKFETAPETAYDLELAEEMEDTAADIISLLRQRSLLKRK